MLLLMIVLDTTHRSTPSHLPTYLQVHEAIREDPSAAPKSDFKGDKNYKRTQKLSYVSR